MRVRLYDIKKRNMVLAQLLCEPSFMELIDFKALLFLYGKQSVNVLFWCVSKQ